MFNLLKLRIYVLSKPIANNAELDLSFIQEQLNQPLLPLRDNLTNLELVQSPLSLVRVL